MRYFCLVCDYDGTLAHDGKVSDTTIDALKRARDSGRKLILATGRQWGDLLAVFPQLPIFDRVVAENGGLLCRPAEREKFPLARPPCLELVARPDSPVRAMWACHLLEDIAVPLVELHSLGHAVMVLAEDFDVGR